MLKHAIASKYCAYPALDSDPMLKNARAEAGFAEIRQAAIGCQNEFLAETGQSHHRSSPHSLSWPTTDHR